MTARCNEMVYDSSGYGLYHPHQCGNRAKYDPDPSGTPTKCGIHSTAANARRKARFDAKYAQFETRIRRNQMIHDLNAEAISIVKSIAEGHNDPRSLCQEWVKRRNGVQV